MKTLFENEVIKVSRNERDYDFIAVVENKTNKKVKIIFNHEDVEDFSIGANDWVGLLADYDGYASLKELAVGRFTVVYQR